MIRRVQILPRAKRQVYESALWWAEHHSVEEASRWLDGMEIALNGLAKNAERFPLAAESEAFDFPLRQLNFRVSRQRTHRVLFSVDGDCVRVYAVRHLAQRDLIPDDLA